MYYDSFLVRKHRVWEKGENEKWREFGSVPSRS